MKGELTSFLQEAENEGYGKDVQVSIRLIKPGYNERRNGWLITFYYLNKRTQLGKELAVFIKSGKEIT